MLIFVLKVLVASILVSIFATWIKLVPRYEKWRHIIAQELINAVILSVVLTVLIMLRIYPTWFVLCALILFVLWLSVRITNGIARDVKEPVSDEKTGK